MLPINGSLVWSRFQWVLSLVPSVEVHYTDTSPSCYPYNCLNVLFFSLYYNKQTNKLSIVIIVIIIIIVCSKPLLFVVVVFLFHSILFRFVLFCFVSLCSRSSVIVQSSLLLRLILLWCCMSKPVLVPIAISTITCHCCCCCCCYCSASIFVGLLWLIFHLYIDSLYWSLVYLVVVSKGMVSSWNPKIYIISVVAIWIFCGFCASIALASYTCNAG